MNIAVVDASAIAAILFAETSGPGVEAGLRGLNLVAPRLLRYEITSVALKKRRANPDDGQDIARALQRYRALRIREFDLPTALIYETAAATGLSGYDAAYLALARALGAPLVTLDAKLAAAAA